MPCLHVMHLYFFGCVCVVFVVNVMSECIVCLHGLPIT